MNADVPVAEIFIRSAIAAGILAVTSYTIGMLHYSGRRLPSRLPHTVGAVTGVAAGIAIGAGVLPSPVAGLISAVLGVMGAFMFPSFLRLQDALRGSVEGHSEEYEDE